MLPPKRFKQNTTKATEIKRNGTEAIGIDQDGIAKSIDIEVLMNKGNVGLGDVDNTSDADKPVSTAQQGALNLKESVANVNTLKGTGWNGETVKGNAEDIATLNGDDSTEGSVAKSIKDNAENATFTPAVGSGIESMTIEEAVNEVGVDVEALKTDSATFAPFVSVTVINPLWNGTDVSINTSTGTITISAHGLVDGDRVAFTELGMTDSTAPAVKAGWAYYVVNKTTDTFQISETSGGSPISITSAGTQTAWQIEKLSISSLVVTGLDLQKCRFVVRGGFSLGNESLRQIFLNINEQNSEARYKSSGFVNMITTSSTAQSSVLKFIVRGDMYLLGKSIMSISRGNSLAVTLGIPAVSSYGTQENFIISSPTSLFGTPTKITSVSVYLSYPVKQFFFNGTTLEVYKV